MELVTVSHIQLRFRQDILIKYSKMLFIPKAQTKQNLPLFWQQ